MVLPGSNSFSILRKIGLLLLACISSKTRDVNYLFTGVFKNPFSSKYLKSNIC